MSVIVEGICNKNNSKSTKLSSPNVWLIWLDNLMGIKVNLIISDLDEGTSVTTLSLQTASSSAANGKGNGCRCSSATPWEKKSQEMHPYSTSSRGTLFKLTVCSTAPCVVIIQKLYWKDCDKLFLINLICVCLKCYYWWYWVFATTLKPLAKRLLSLSL